MEAHTCKKKTKQEQANVGRSILNKCVNGLRWRKKECK